MKLFTCTNCGQILYFENTWCQHCGLSTGLAEQNSQLFAISTNNGGAFVLTDKGQSTSYHYCANHAYDVCNWLVPHGHATPFCSACGLNHTIPNLQQPAFRERWALIEAAKHRLVYTLLRLKLPFANKLTEPETGLRFDFVADERGDKKITGHDNGLITINIKEADDIEREKARKNMQEPYRTLLGHCRHEIGHYYWDTLVRDDYSNLTSFRQLFGDERYDYDDALAQHYQNGAPAAWAQQYISAYASSHPWEDWAETWAHYMHVMDTLETAWAYNIRIKPGLSQATDMQAEITTDPYTENNFDNIIRQWLPLTYAMNSLNRSMGIGDVYPFVIAPAVVQKLAYIHNICCGQSRNNNSQWSYFS